MVSIPASVDSAEFTAASLRALQQLNMRMHKSAWFASAIGGAHQQASRRSIGGQAQGAAIQQQPSPQPSHLCYRVHEQRVGGCIEGDLPRQRVRALPALRGQKQLQ